MKKLIPFLLGIMCSMYAFAGPRNMADNNQSFSFIENKGQIADQFYHFRNDIQFKLDEGDVNVFIGYGQIHYQWIREAGSSSADIYRLDVALQGADMRAPVITEQQQPGYERYYLTQCPDGVVAHSFKKLTYKNVYPNIDWVLYTNNNQLKYDFVVHPGGNPSDIQLKYSGATSLNINNGALIANTPFGSITEHAPYSYKPETKEVISSKFILVDNALSFDIAPYTGTLIIDPAITVDWRTFFGGSGTALEGFEYGYGVATDVSGNVIMVGQTSSASNIATTGAFLTTHFTGKDAYAAKFNTSGNLVWATYYGNIADDLFKAAACDITGNIYCAGSTYSTSGITTSGVFHPNISNGVDVMLVKFDASGARQWGTYYGGSSVEDVVGLSCDLAGNIYIAGNTASDTGIASSGAHQTAHSALNDGFLAKFNPSGNRLWGTYYGGIGADALLDMKFTITGDIVICGEAQSDTGIATSTGFEPAYHNVSGHPNYGDAFLAKFNTSGVRQWGTYYGDYGNGTERFDALSTDASGNIYACGLTSSTANIATAGAYSTTPAAGMLIKFDSTGTRVWGTYSGTGVAMFSDLNDNQYYLASANSNAQYVLSKWDKNGSYISPNLLGNGETSTIGSTSMVYNPVTGKLFIACNADSINSNNLTTAGAYQTVCRGSKDALLSSYIIDSGLNTKTPVKNSADLNIYPNPNRGSFTLNCQFNNTHNRVATVIVVNTLGSVIYTSDIPVNAGSIQQQISLDAPAGLYMVQLKYDGEKRTQKLIIQ